MEDLKETAAQVKAIPRRVTQLGLNHYLRSQGSYFSNYSGLDYNQLVLYDDIARREPILAQGIKFIKLAIISKLGIFTHPNNEIENLVRRQIKNKLSSWLDVAIHDLLVFGRYLGEPIYELYNKGGVVERRVVDIARYHPIQIHIQLNDFNRLTDGEKVTNSVYKSGVYVPVPAKYIGYSGSRYRDVVGGTLVRLPERRRIYLTSDETPYGSSILDSVVIYQQFKEAFRDFLFTALHRYGTPLIYAIVPPLETDIVIDEIDGVARKKSYADVVSEAFENLSGQSGLVFTQISNDQPIKIATLTNQNNFSDAFTSAITDICDANMLTGLGIPNLLFKDKSSSLGSGQAGEFQIETFSVFVSSLFNQIVKPMVAALARGIIYYNFPPTATDYYEDGEILERPYRVSELKVILSGVKDLTELNYMSSSNADDINFVRSILGMELY